MTPEIIIAVGEYVVMPICGAAAFIAFIYFGFKDRK